MYECDYRRSFGLYIGFIEHFNTQLVIQINYSAIADFHTLKITPAHYKHFPACSVLSRRFPVTASNYVCSSASVLKSSLNGGSFLTASYSLLTPRQESISHQPPSLLVIVWFSAQVKVKFMLQSTVSQPVCLGVRHPFGIYDRIFFLSDSFGFAVVGRSLWREEESVFYYVQFRIYVFTFYMLWHEYVYNIWFSTAYESESHVTTDGQSASLSWNKATIWGLRPDFYYCQTVTGLLMWGALSVERTGVFYNCCCFSLYNLFARTE
jgi:hypothetical protein